MCMCLCECVCVFTYMCAYSSIKRIAKQVREVGRLEKIKKLKERFLDGNESYDLLMPVFGARTSEVNRQGYHILRYFHSGRSKFFQPILPLTSSKIIFFRKFPDPFFSSSHTLNKCI